MSINFTFFGEIISFFLLIIFTMKFVWPHLISAIEAREQLVADAEHQVANAKIMTAKVKQEANDIITNAKDKAQSIIDDAERYAKQLQDNATVRVEEYIAEAKKDAHNNIEQEKIIMQEQLQKKFATLILTTTQSLLESDLSSEERDKFLEKIKLL